MPKELPTRKAVAPCGEPIDIAGKWRVGIEVAIENEEGRGGSGHLLCEACGVEWIARGHELAIRP